MAQTFDPVGTPPVKPLAVIQQSGLALAFILTCVSAYLSHLGLQLIGAVTGLLCLMAWREAVRIWPFVALCLALVVWAIISMQWSGYAALHPWDLGRMASWEKQTPVKLAVQTLLLLPIPLMALRLGAPSRDRAMSALFYAVLALAALMLLEGIGQGGLYNQLRTAIGDPKRPDLAFVGIGQALFVLAAFYWAFVASVQHRPRAVLWTLGVAVMLGISTFLFRINAPLVALVASAGVFWMVKSSGAKLARTVMAPLAVALAGLVILGFPFFVQALDQAGVIEGLVPKIGDSWAARLQIWSFAAERIAEKPLVGWGIDASRTFDPNIPIHTHNFVLQVWLELGLVGALIFTGLWGLLFWMASRAGEGDDASEPGYAMAMLMVFFVIGNLSFGVWQEWWLAMAALATTALILALRLRRQEKANFRPFDELTPL